jgi:PiT family inorganic phosphate transporter
VVEALLLVGIAVAVFVGFNIGGSSTGVAFGPAVGSGVVSKLAAAGLMSAFALLGGWTVGRNVIETMGGRIVPSGQFTLAASVGVLFFVGLALLLSNLFGVPASTSMTAVGAIAGLGVASNTISWEVMGQIVVWWLVAPVLAFWVCAVIGRYLYPYLDAAFALEGEGDGEGEGRSTRETVGAVLVVGIGCYMAFSAGASNVANAVAPLVGSGAIADLVGSEALGLNVAIVVGAAAIGLGAFTIARRTLETVGNDLTDLPLLAALIVEVVSASIITFLSAIGIPASLAVSATMCIVGLGWGRATRTTTLTDAATAAVGANPADTGAEMGAAPLTGDPRPEGDVRPIGEEQSGGPTAGDLFDPAATGRVISLWILTPTIAAVASYALFSLLPVYGGG